jgi:DNA invertase Pin-like site-specific DNA recombinase
MDLPQYTKDVLKLYSERALTRQEAARLLAVSERQVSRWMRLERLARQESRSAKYREEAEERRLIKEGAAHAVAAGKITIREAALRAGCSLRTMYRLLKKL